MGCWRALYDSIAPKPRLFSFEVKKCPRAFFDRGRKKPRLRRLYCHIEPDNTPYMQYIHHFRLIISFSNLVSRIKKYKKASDLAIGENCVHMTQW